MKIITLCLKDEKFELFKKFAELENKDISNFIETATSKYIEGKTFADEFETAELHANTGLQTSLSRGRTDVKENRRRII